MSAVDPVAGRAGLSGDADRAMPVRRYMVLMLTAVALPILMLTGLVAWGYVEAQRE